MADDLLDLGFEMPSVYLLNGGRLRCHGSRGCFRVVDGFPPGTDVIGSRAGPSSTPACAPAPAHLFSA